MQTNILEKEEIFTKVKEAFGYQNINQTPKVTKIVLNMGLGQALTEPKILEVAEEQLKIISGQKPGLRRAKKSIASFKLRKGQAIGLRVTLRGSRVVDFLKKLGSVVFPRVRDFRGLSEKNFDGRGNYTIGFKDATVFPEIPYVKGEKPLGLEITIVTSAKNNEEAKALLEILGLLFKR